MVKKLTKSKWYPSRTMTSFADAWLLMLALGGIGHQLHIHQLFLAYWTCWLIMLATICIFPGNEFPVKIKD